MIGIDLGSRQVKMIQMQQGQVIRREMADTIGFYRQYGRVRDGQLQIDLLEAGWSGDRWLLPDMAKWPFLSLAPNKYLRFKLMP